MTDDHAVNPATAGTLARRLRQSSTILNHEAARWNAERSDGACRLIPAHRRSAPAAHLTAAVREQAMDTGERADLVALGSDSLRLATVPCQRGTVEFTDSPSALHIRWGSRRRAGIVAEAAGPVRGTGGSS
jgi:hypothetical protein